MLDVASGVTFCPLRLAVESGSAESVLLLLHSGFKPMGYHFGNEGSFPLLFRLAAASGNTVVSFEPIRSELKVLTLRVCHTGGASTSGLGAR
jgi:hypothetical protein